MDTQETLSYQVPFLSPGLYVVATPIGNRADLSLRALSTLQAAHVIYCEDTRVSRVLMEGYGVKTPLLPYHEHNAHKVRPKILTRLQEGQAVALISDAGTPLISDPGYRLIQACQEKGFFYTAVPGPCAVVNSLVLAGLPTDRFTFCGFANPKTFKELSNLPTTLVFYESPHRLKTTLKKMRPYFENRTWRIVREMTKVFEEVIFGTIDDLCDRVEAGIKGECVIVLSPPEVSQVFDDAKIEAYLQLAMTQTSLKDAVSRVAHDLNLPRQMVYAHALRLKSSSD